jgi:hypothetical protein
MSFIFEAIGYAKAGESEYEAAKYNAETARAESLAKSNAQREQAKAQIGSIRAGISKSGASFEGTPLTVLAESAANAEIDALNTLYSGERESTLAMMQGRAARTAGYFKAGTSLLKAAEKSSYGG